MLLLVLIGALMLLPQVRQAAHKFLQRQFASTDERKRERARKGNRRLLVLLLLYLGYSATLIWSAWHVGGWEPSMAWGTFVVVFTVGIPLVVRTLQPEDGGEFVRTVARIVFGVSVPLVLYVNAAPFSIPVEIIVQILAFGFGLMHALATRSKSPNPRRVADVGLALIGIAMIVHTTVYLGSGLPAETWRSIALIAALTVWFPVALVPFLYVFAYYAAAEVASSHVIAYARPNGRPRKIPALLRLLLACRFRLGYARAFTGEWARRHSRARTRGERRQLLVDFRSHVRSSQAERDRSG